MSVATKKLPGTSYSVQLHPHPTSKNGKLSLIKGKWPVAEKICPALDSKTVISILEDIIDSEGFELNPRILSRIAGELLEELGEAPKVSAVAEKPSLIEMEEKVPSVSIMQPLPEVTVTPPISEETAPPLPTSPTPTLPKPIESTLSEATFEHIKVLKTQIKELQALVKTISEKFDALNIIAEKLEGQTD